VYADEEFLQNWLQLFGQPFITGESEV